MYSTKTYCDKTRSAFGAPAGKGDKDQDRNKFTFVSGPSDAGSRKVPERWKGKRLQVSASLYMPNPKADGKLTSTGGFFSFPPAYASEDYGLAVRKYGGTAKFLAKDKVPFGSANPARRDEFTSAVRSNQYRSQIAGEAAVARKQLVAALQRAGADVLASSTGGGSSGGEGAGDAAGVPAPLASPMRDPFAGRRSPSAGGGGSEADAVASRNLAHSPDALRSLADALEASLRRPEDGAGGTRSFTRKTEYDRAHDDRSAAEIYPGASPGSKALALGPFQRESDTLGQGIQSSPHHAPRHGKRRVR